MQATELNKIHIEKTLISSIFLARDVNVNFYLPCNIKEPSNLSLLLINDGQNLEEMKFPEVLDELISSNEISPLLCVGIYANENRKMEYGIASQADYVGWGADAALFQSFVLKELMPLIKQTYFLHSFKDISYLGFSLGGLCALDIVWNNADIFSRAGVFSGSLWWRRLDQYDIDYDDDKHRIMHQQIRNDEYKKGLQFFFQCGNKDELSDRNKNGIIDSIDDTLDLISELVKKGYDRNKDIHFMEMKEGRHDLATWAEAIPDFLKWGWGKGL